MCVCVLCPALCVCARPALSAPHAPSAALYPAAGTRWQWQWQQRGRACGRRGCGRVWLGVCLRGGLACALFTPALTPLSRTHAHARIAANKCAITGCQCTAADSSNGCDCEGHSHVKCSSVAGAFVCDSLVQRAPARPTRRARPPRRRKCAPVCDGAAAWACVRAAWLRARVAGRGAAHALARAHSRPHSHTFTHTHFVGPPLQAPATLTTATASPPPPSSLQAVRSSTQQRLRPCSLPRPMWPLTFYSLPPQLSQSP